MANIVVQELSLENDPLIYRVEVIEGDSNTSHKVELERDHYLKLTDGKIAPHELVHSSFEFLLEREPKESILSSFNLTIISRYFPEYSEEIINYF